jgi:cyclopropane fatty-acyl-phospholipid synthase-like methyltransferase
MSGEKMKEPQYDALVKVRDDHGFARFGLMSNQVWYDDPRRICFCLSRYKFVAKMLSGKGRVLEIGCGDAIGARIVLQEVGSVCAVDFDPVFVRDVHDRMTDRWKFECKVHDILSGPVPGEFDAAYTMDLLEHLPEKYEKRFLSNIAESLVHSGVLIVGTPSIQSQAYASEQSKKGHINCKDHNALRELMQNHFENVFLFSMNDEVVHTGFYAMAHYLIAMGVGKKTAPGSRF